MGSPSTGVGAATGAATSTGAFSSLINIKEKIISRNKIGTTCISMHSELDSCRASHPTQDFLNNHIILYQLSFYITHVMLL
jgi:hypothetical protein